MPFPFTLPTTSFFAFSSHFETCSHPSLPISASTHRGVLHSALKNYKHLPPSSQASNLSSISLALENYLPYLLALDAGLASQSVSAEEIHIVLTSTPILEWRPTLSSSAVPGREPQRLKLKSLEYEVLFVLSTLAYTHTLLSRIALQPLYSSATASPTQEQRTAAVTTATKHLLSAASIHSYLSTRAESLPSPAPCIDISASTFRALSSLALAEATLLAVLKDDPYPAAVAQDRNKNDKEWMIKAPEIPKVRAHLFARLCLAASEHAAQAASLLSGGSSKTGKIDEDLLRYVEDVKRVGKAKACRFFAIDADLGSQTGMGIAWLRAGLTELGITVKEEDTKKSARVFGRLKKDWSEKREDKKVEAGAAWGADAGKAEEARILTMLDTKWSKMNDTINTQLIPPTGPLLATIPSGREIHSLKPYILPSLDAHTLQALRAPPDHGDEEHEDDEYEDSNSDADADADAAHAPGKHNRRNIVGAFPGTEHVAGGSSSSSSYY